jgi:hypothetical protein
MPRRAKLTNIASGLCGSFASRNNDLNGYWSIGILRSLADKYGRTSVSLDLLTSSMQPSSCEFVPVLARYHQLLAKLVDLSRIELDEITTAHVTFDFAPRPWPRASCYRSNWGDQFILTVTINAAGRTAGIARHVGYCRPHDPARETRSIRSAAH